VPCAGVLDALKISDPDDHSAVLAGLARLRSSQNHREPLSKAVSDGLFELRHLGKLNTRVFCSSGKAAESSQYTVSATKAGPSPPRPGHRQSPNGRLAGKTDLMIRFTTKARRHKERTHVPFPLPALCVFVSLWFHPQK